MVAPNAGFDVKILFGSMKSTLEVRAGEVTTSIVGSAPMLSVLLAQFSSDQGIGSVTAKGVFGTRKCRHSIAVRGAGAVIPAGNSA